MERDILSYMNAWSNKNYDRFQVNTIGRAIEIEFKERGSEGIIINGKTKAGRRLLDIRVADVANRILSNKVTPEDIRLYKKCRMEEYQDRTGKCAWGIKNVRKKLGYDEETGKELI